MTVLQDSPVADIFATIDPTRLDNAEDAFLDSLPFGVIGLSDRGLVEVYNAWESRHAGMRRDTVLGQEFFLTTGICMNNFMVSQRFEDEDELDALVDYILTFRMRPTQVTLRLLKRQDLRRRYILLRR